MFISSFSALSCFPKDFSHVPAQSRGTVTSQPTDQSAATLTDVFMYSFRVVVSSELAAALLFLSVLLRR